MATTPTSIVLRLMGTEAFTDGLNLSGGALVTGPGAGLTGGSGSVAKSSVQRLGGIYTTRFFVDLTGLGSSTTDGDIIGQSTPVAYLCQITAAECGTIVAGRVTCLVVPTTGVTDIDLFYATAATGKFDDAVSGLAGQTIVLSSGGAWTLALTKAITGLPAANSYIYVCNGTSGTVGTYAAGQLLIELFGT